MIKCVIFVFLYVFVKVRYMKVNIIYKCKNKCWQDIVNICKVNLSNYMRGDTVKDHC